MQQLVIGHLYPKEMNIYGDTGNVLVLHKRAQWRGIGVKVVGIHPGDTMPNDIDILVSGGGQDQGQVTVMQDLQKRKSDLQARADDGVVMLVVCGTYQLFGHRFVPHEGDELPGISIFDAETLAGDKRLIGNMVIDSEFGQLVGYENHSGRTKLMKGQQALGKVLSGAGNNGDDGREGAVTQNVFGTYLHGPLLPKNPQFADELLRRALVRKYGDAELSELDDSVANRARDVASKRPR